MSTELVKANRVQGEIVDAREPSGYLKHKHKILDGAWLTLLEGQPQIIESFAGVRLHLLQLAELVPSDVGGEQIYDILEKNDPLVYWKKEMLRNYLVTVADDDTSPLLDNGFTAMQGLLPPASPEDGRIENWLGGKAERLENALSDKRIRRIHRKQAKRDRADLAPLRTTPFIQELVNPSLEVTRYIAFAARKAGLSQDAIDANAESIDQTGASIVNKAMQYVRANKAIPTIMGKYDGVVTSYNTALSNFLQSPANASEAFAQQTQELKKRQSIALQLARSIEQIATYPFSITADSQRLAIEEARQFQLFMRKGRQVAEMFAIHTIGQFLEWQAYLMYAFTDAALVRAHLGIQGQVTQDMHRVMTDQVNSLYGLLTSLPYESEGTVRIINQKKITGR